MTKCRNSIKLKTKAVPIAGTGNSPNCAENSISPTMMVGEKAEKMQKEEIYLLHEAKREMLLLLLLQLFLLVDLTLSNGTSKDSMPMMAQQSGEQTNLLSQKGVPNVSSFKRPEQWPTVQWPLPPPLQPPSSSSG